MGWWGVLCIRLGADFVLGGAILDSTAFKWCDGVDVSWVGCCFVLGGATSDSTAFRWRGGADLSWIGFAFVLDGLPLLSPAIHLPRLGFLHIHVRSTHHAIPQQYSSHFCSTFVLLELASNIPEPLISS